MFPVWPERWILTGGWKPPVFSFREELIPRGRRSLPRRRNQLALRPRSGQDVGISILARGLGEVLLDLLQTRLLISTHPRPHGCDCLVSGFMPLGYLQIRFWKFEDLYQQRKAMLDISRKKGGRSSRSFYLAQDFDNRLIRLSLSRLCRHAYLDGVFSDRGHAFSGLAGAWLDAAVDEKGVVSRLFGSGDVPDGFVEGHYD